MLTTAPRSPASRRDGAIALRHLIQMTQRDLAARLGISPALVAYVEVGARWPTPGLAARWAAVLGVDVELIFPSDDDAPAGNGREVISSAVMGDGRVEA